MMDLYCMQTLKKLEKLMDADDETALKMLSFPRGTNPFLDRERCLLCNCERVDPPEADAIRAETAERQSPENNPLSQGSCLQFPPLWVCPSCRKAADQEIDKKPTLEQFLDQDSELFLPDVSIKSGSEPTTPNGSICSCDACTERSSDDFLHCPHSLIESEHDMETSELQQCWMDLRKVVRCLYSTRDDNVDTSHLLSDEHITDYIHRLCSRDPHQLFLRLESQVREFVIEMKVKLLKQLSTGFKTPPQARMFIGLMLAEYAHLCRVARRMAGLLKELQNHLKRFKVTWDLHNKHLFQSVVFSEPSIKNSLNLLIQQLRIGAASKESYSEDTYPNLLHRFLKFEDEMSVINVVWRDCHQLIETYNEEQSALKLKQKMLREDWEFFKTQRKLLEQSVNKNSKASLSHNLEAQFTETMRLMLQGNKPTQDELTCPRCNRKRCPCDECTITHMITCGIINPDVLDSTNAPNPLTSHHNANFLHDPNRYRIDVSPPSMSSTTSSSGSSSPIMVETERLNRPFPETENTNEDEIQEEIEESQSYSGDEDDEDGDYGDDEAEIDDGSSSKLGPAEIPDLPPLKEMVKFPLMPPLMMDGDDPLRRQDLAGKLDSCNCDHCVSQAKLEQLKPEENQCQCHVCLQQQGKAVSTSLPQHLPPALPRPGELHLYPHIHGSTGLHSLGRAHPRPILQQNLYNLHDTPLSPAQHKALMNQTKMPDFDSDGLSDQMYAYGEWDNTYDPRLLLGSGKFESELLPPPPFSSPYTSSLLTEPLSLPGMLSTASTTAISTTTPTSSFVSTAGSHTVIQAASVATKLFDNLAVVSTKDSLGEQLAGKHPPCSNQGPAPPHKPPCSRPATLGGNNNTTQPKVAEKGHAQHCRKHNSQGNVKSGVGGTSHNHVVQKPPGDGRVGPGSHPRACAHLTAAAAAANSKVASHMGTLVNANNTCTNGGMHLPNSVNNVSVGTSTCTEPDCDGNHDNDSYDDNCSEKSSSTTNSTNQKEGKYCDCCYCEFFGHGNPPMAPTSKNFVEMRDKLRLRLKKKAQDRPDDEAIPPTRCTGPSSQIKATPPVVAPFTPPVSVSPAPPSDPLETKGLDELIKFINGTEEDEDNKPLSAKALKRARQKQRKAEEKARQDEEERVRRLKEERDRQRKLREAEEQQRRIREIEEQQRHMRDAEDARRAEERAALGRKGRGKAGVGSKGSSNSPSPQQSNSNGGQIEGKGEQGQDKNKSQKKRGKQREDQAPLQVNITCEIETSPSSAVTSRAPLTSSHSNMRVPASFLSNHNVNSTSGGGGNGPRVLGVTQENRPTTTGGKATVTHPSIDNRLILTANRNKNKDPPKVGPPPPPHMGNGDARIVSSQAQEHISKITLQQQEILKKQTQQLIQLKLQAEAKKQLQKQQQQQQQQQPKQPPVVLQSDKRSGVKTPVQNGTVTQNVVGAALQLNQKIPLKNNVKITVKTTANPAAISRPETPNNQQTRLANSRVQQNNEVNRQNNNQTQQQQQQQQASATKRGKKPVDNINQQQQQQSSSPRNTTPQPSQQSTASTQKLTTGLVKQHLLGQNGLIGPAMPVKGQVRQPPQGQANGDMRTPTPDERSRGKGQDDSPPSDQGKNSGGKTKKPKKKIKVSGDNFIDEVFMPKSESDIEGGEMDEVEKELEEFKRFCVDTTPAKREKLQVNINIKDIFSKKKTGLCS
ncbi:protein FAM193A-like isoform X3 [Mya arenaria]|uniref:protein FAM193A-like isoform X3 n=1 Tax=Mya arenaria TaxID=6604 RepID=UPI0022E4A01A|nr:protein FAM193A-like isoform X3 [Mya arenaria]